MQHWLDDLARFLAGSRSRRGVLRSLGAALAGAAASSIMPGVVRATDGNNECAHWCKTVFPSGTEHGQCTSDAAHGTGLCYKCGPMKPPGSTLVLCGQRCVPSCAGGKTFTLGDCTCVCPDDKPKDCGGTCIPAGQCCTNADCGGGKICQQGECVCPADKPKLCGGTCIVDTSCCTDDECSGGTVCRAGACVCSVDQKLCNSVCIPATDCCTDGDCPSGSGKICRGGACVCPSTRPDDCGGICVDTQSDAEHCGRCGNACRDTNQGTTDRCVGGVCRHECPPERKPCRDTCIPVVACCDDVECLGGRVCRAGACVCPAGTQLCQDRCVGTCDSGQVLDSASCRCESAGGTCGNYPICSGSTQCILTKTAEGGSLCSQRSTRCKGLPRCTSSAGCPAGSTCIVGTCCRKGGVCLPGTALCSSSDLSARAGKVKRQGPTIGQR